MTILRIHKKQNNFVILDKTCLHDEKLSWGAKGLHAFLISMPDDWSVRVGHLQHQATNGRDAVRGFLSELQKSGYIKKSSKRDNGSGRFEGVEYLVLEFPEPEFNDYSPETEKPFSVKNGQLSPETKKPATGNPASENPTVINNNKINNKEINKKTTTTNKSDSSAKSQELDNIAAAVSSPSIKRLPSQDALIGEELSLSQKQRVIKLVDSLNISEGRGLIEEIEFCLLNNKHFSGCGNDFSRKLNAIRSVIFRGDWQTPVGMVGVIDTPPLQQVHDTVVLELELQKTYAEAAHFKKLMDATEDNTHASFEKIFIESKNKIKALEEKLNKLKILQSA